MKVTVQPQLNTKIQEGNLMRDFGKRKKSNLQEGNSTKEKKETEC